MAEINLLDRLPTVKRNLDKRAEEKNPDDVARAKQFGFDYFDGERRHGYGGYRYDGRWVPVAERFAEHYGLAPDGSILDVGCGKGFLMHDFLQLLPGATVRGLDISAYAKEHAQGNTGPLIDLGSADALPYPDASFDLVLSINTVHNLPPERCKRALREIQRVGRAHRFISVDAWHNDAERRALEAWVLTAETYMSVHDWVNLFGEVGYTGDYWWFIP